MQVISSNEKSAHTQQDSLQLKIPVENKLDNITVLVVDDEPSILESLSEYLLAMNYNVIKCDTGSAALDTFESNNTGIDVIILDMILPDMGGREVYEKMYKIDPELNVIIMTGYSTVNDIDYVKKLGVKKVLYKPFHYNILDSMLQEIMRDKDLSI